MNLRVIFAERLQAVINFSAKRYNSLPNSFGPPEIIEVSKKWAKINERGQTLSCLIRELDIDQLKKKVEVLEKDIRLLDDLERQEYIEKTVTDIKAPKMIVSVPDEEGQTTLKIGRGGRRMGAGRKKNGEQRKASLSLPPDKWELVDRIKQLEGKNQSDVLAELIISGLDSKLIELMENDGTIKWEVEEDES